jgi:hypothetical protein
MQQTESRKQNLFGSFFLDFFVNKMTETTNFMFDIFADQSQCLTGKIGASFQEIFPINRTTFAHVKC